MFAPRPDASDGFKPASGIVPTIVYGPGMADPTQAPDEAAILDAAGALGATLADHPAVKELKSASKAFADDKLAQQAMIDFQRAYQTIAEKQQAGQPIEVSDKQRLETIQNQVIGNPQLQRVQTAQMNCVDLLRKIDQKLTAAAGLDQSALATPGAGAPTAGAPGPGLI